MKAVYGKPGQALMALICFFLSYSHSVQAEDSFWPGKHRWKTAFLNAVQDPHTWVPIAGALLSQVGDMDQRISDKASNYTPLFSSRSNADEAKYALLDVSRIGMLVTVLAVPDNEHPVSSRLYRGAVQGGGVLLVHRITWEVKYEYPRARPDNTSNNSFFSSYASGGSAFSAFAKSNLDEVPMSPNKRRWAQASVSGAAMLLAWSRVEAKKHYPSDVLIGYAAGNFIASFINDSFLGKEYSALGVIPKRNGLSVHLQKRFY